MFGSQYEFIVNDEPLFKLVPTVASSEITRLSRHSQVQFLFNGTKYKYEWVSSPSSGLGYLYRENPEGKWETIYDPYFRNPEPKHVSLHEAAIQLYTEIKKHF